MTGKELARIRRAAGLSQADLVTAVGILTRAALGALAGREGRRDGRIATE